MEIVGFSIGAFGSFYLLYSRKSEAVSARIKWISTAILFILGVLLLVKHTTSDQFVVGWGMAMPFVFLVITYFFDFVTKQVYGRPYILWLQWSDEIDTRLGAINDHVGILDKIFSLASVAIILGATACGAIIARSLG